MAGLTLKVTNRSRKGLKALPTTIELPNDATIEDAKKAVARAAKVSDYNRIGIFDPVSNKTFKDKKSLVRDQPEVIKRGELLVKDLGPQISWKLVYATEYIGPLLFHPLFLGLRNYIYPAVYPLLKNHLPYARVDGALSYTQQVSFAITMAHFAKRELEVLFLHKFSVNTMPFAYIFRNSFYYWATAGFLAGLEIYAPFSLAAWAEEPTLVTYIGLALFAFGELANFDVHYYLTRLRKPGETARKIPKGHGFSIVTCPNYMFEIIAWVGIIMVTRSPSMLLSIIIGSYYMYTWGRGKEKAYREQFGDKYKRKRYVMLPGLL
ncbi:3-oxo-5-alpha-steroid 4-dehydrogenase-domain-containing protein [Hypoxylon trugodes]|uniref:3-oxo-5-alpha-steroid 4-dehydrogenase-domain-containing protein n=1 Tax=Hypoxylon trugodes TaxID=326681 RepID=UPI00219B715A|nr:3-oxo-5-alpha-steroid 4-dehydrogenase-domain-containing protein [Hypoxylon trugodes]KAI1388689.1 3-oxo-5-alpha-steroid 4-dehydrogenase-domain-containing protein [Hypoxylon trugodes]